MEELVVAERRASKEVGKANVEDGVDGGEEREKMTEEDTEELSEEETEELTEDEIEWTEWTEGEMAVEVPSSSFPIFCREDEV